MPNIAGTGVPAAVTATCPRCHATRLFTAAGAPEQHYTCAGCEWPFTFGAGSSPLSTNAAVTAGTSTALPFASGGTQFLLGQTLFVNDGAASEVVVVNGTPTGTSVPVSGFDNNHNSGVAITVAVATPTLSNQEIVPANPGWGF